MIIIENTAFTEFTQWVNSLQRRLHNCDNAGLRCNGLKGNDHSAPLRLDLHHHSRTLNAIQPRI